ncbi:phosphotransferase enzyme family protein [Streptomyces sp. bgisy022]|uniref:phosphotransferase enzyme family protein n=1 Tax=Streptomyces sp. bgisy022 TaxID=3413769 RepID=UPI003D74DE6E
MQAADARRAVRAAVSVASSLGLPVDDATVLHDSNKLAVRLRPCDVVARVAPVAQQVAEFEVELAQQLVRAGCPVAAPDPRVEPRVHERDGFVVTLWTHHASVTTGDIAPADYADALARLHAGMRTLDVPVPHLMERVQRAQGFVADRERTPELGDADRVLLGDRLRDVGRFVSERGAAGEQLLHGEPHPGNLLATRQGLLFIDLETCCRGPVEFDLAHAPDAVGAHYPGVDGELLRACRLLVQAVITSWRWDRDDRFPDGRRMGVEGLDRIRAAVT